MIYPKLYVVDVKLYIGLLSVPFNLSVMAGKLQIGARLTSSLWCIGATDICNHFGAILR